MDRQHKINLITRNTQEIVTREELEKLLEEKENPKVYLGTAITGRPHIAYFLWVLKISDFLKAGCKVKLLLADIHGALDKTPWDLLEARFEYYQKIISLMFESIGTPTSNFEIVKGSSFQKTPEYFYDVLKMSSYASIHDAKKAASEVVKQDENPKLSGLIYPIMQALDEQYLDVDIQYGGLDQRKILMFAREYLPKLGYKARIELMTPILPGLVGKKMSASDTSSKIDLLDDAETVKQKLNKANCIEGEIEDNGVLAFVKNIIFPLKEDFGQEFTITRPEKYGGSLSYKTYSYLEEDFKEKKLHPMDLKAALAEEINKLLEPVRLGMDEELIKRAYPE